MKLGGVNTAQEELEDFLHRRLTIKEKGYTIWRIIRRALVKEKTSPEVFQRAFQTGLLEEGTKKRISNGG